MCPGGDDRPRARFSFSVPHAAFPNELESSSNDPTFEGSNRGEKTNAAWRIHVWADRIETDHDGPELTQHEPLLLPEATALSPASVAGAQGADRQVGCGMNIPLPRITHLPQHSKLGVRGLRGGSLLMAAGHKLGDSQLALNRLNRDLQMD